MQLNGLLHGARLLSHVDFPTSEVLRPDAGEDQIQDLIARHGLIFIKPVFRGGVGKKGKSWGVVAVLQAADFGLEAYPGSRVYDHDDGPETDYQGVSSVPLGARWRFGAALP